MKPAILVDAGPLVAILNRSDAAHDKCRTTLPQLDPPLLTTWPVLTEAAWLLRHRPDLVQQLIRSANEGFLQLAWLDESDAEPIADILERYADQSFQLADASLMHVAERQELDVVFTLDRRDFLVFRRAGGQHLKIIPD